MAETYFDILGLPPTSDFGRIASAYARKKVELKNDPIRLHLLEQAYRVLMNPISLRHYLENPQPIEISGAPIGADSAGTNTFSSEKQWLQNENPIKPSRKRQMTEILDVEGEPSPEPVPSKSSNTKGGRKQTEFVEPGAEEKPVDEPAEPASKRVADESKSVPPGEIKSVQSETRSSANILFTYAGETKRFILKEGENVIGRPPKNGALPDIPLMDAEYFISRRHAVILVEGSKYQIKDMGSDNGTSLNGERLQPLILYPLKDGDVVEIEMRRLKLSISTRQ